MVVLKVHELISNLLLIFDTKYGKYSLGYELLLCLLQKKNEFILFLLRICTFCCGRVNLSSTLCRCFDGVTRLVCGDRMSMV